jgi:gamma-glutamyltranspeptidase/glutathione hydrolase
MLNILEGFDLAKLGHNSAEYLHLLIEAKKLAFADRDRYLADPEKARVPLERLISKDYAAERRRLIDPERAADEVAPGLIDTTETVYLTVVDEKRNVVSFIYSVFDDFGSGRVVPGTGIALQNRGAGFSLEAGHPNEIAPGKRALHTNMPGMVFKNGKPWISYGVMGGDMQPQGHTQVLLNLIDFGMNVQQAGEAARFRHFGDGAAAFESGIDIDVLQALIRKGHRPMTRMGAYGGYQAIEIDWENGVLAGGSDPRKDGCALGY